MDFKKYNILIAEDDSGFAKQLQETFEAEGYRTFHAKDGHEAIYYLQNQKIDMGFLDLAMPGLDGMDVLERAAKIAAEVPLVMITGYASIDKAVKATQLGAYDFIEKPASLERLLLTAKHALEKSDLSRKSQWMINEIQSRYKMIGRSDTMKRIYSLIHRISKVSSPVLITGETGTGKELVARALHLQSVRSDGPFVKLNCAAIPETLIESEMFGHARGAFTGAETGHAGKFLQAHKGTLFLDEIGDLSLSAQAKLLRVLQDKKVDQIGREKSISVDVRILAASNKNFEELIEKEKFRKDLFYRLNNFEILLPPLRERKEDIPDLCQHFLQLFSQEYNKNFHDLDKDAMQVLLDYEWPGNVRELRALFDRLITLLDSNQISAQDIAIYLHAQSKQFKPKSYHDAMKELEREYLVNVLLAHRWKVSDAAKTLNLDRTNLYKKIQQLNITKP